MDVLGNLVFSFALSAPDHKELTMKTAVTILALTFFAIAPAAAKSAASAPGHHKGVHDASSNAPGHVKKRANKQSARSFSPGHNK
jgi:hypothetical protein